MVTVAEAARLTPRMMRVVFESEELEGFRSDAFDDHIRLFFPVPGAALRRPRRGPNGLIYPEGAPRPVSRDYTPRRFDPSRNRLTVDFVLHGEGPGSGWAERARPGDTIGVAGPQNSQVVRGTYDWHLFAGDETALPAIGRRIEELASGQRIVAVIEIADARERQTFATGAETDIRWVERDKAPGRTPLLDAVQSTAIPRGRGFAFVACENASARELRRHLLADRGLDPAAVRAYRFWQRGSPDLGQS
jgi:NADPH-dependent ferric siderophore reductase